MGAIVQLRNYARLLRERKDIMAASTAKQPMAAMKETIIEKPRSSKTRNPVEINGLLENRLHNNRRNTGRRGTTICNVLIEGDVTPHRVSVTNLTATGLQLKTLVACEVGSRVKVHLPNADSKAMEGTIRYVCRIKDESGARYAYGVEFD